MAQEALPSRYRHLRSQLDRTVSRTELDTLLCYRGRRVRCNALTRRVCRVNEAIIARRFLVCAPRRSAGRERAQTARSLVRLQTPPANYMAETLYVPSVPSTNQRARVGLMAYTRRNENESLIDLSTSSRVMVREVARPAQKHKTMMDAKRCMTVKI